MGFHWFKYMKGNGNLSGRSLKRIKGLTGFAILSYLK